MTDEIGGNVSAPEPVALAEGHAADFSTTPAAALPMAMAMAMAMAMIVFLLAFGPITMIGLWLFFLLMPGNPGHNHFGHPSRGDRAAGSPQNKRRHNPDAGYASFRSYPGLTRPIRRAVRGGSGALQVTGARTGRQHELVPYRPTRPAQ